MNGEYIYQSRFGPWNMETDPQIVAEQAAMGGGFWESPFGQFLEGVVPVLGEAVAILRPPRDDVQQPTPTKTNLTWVYVIGAVILVLLLVLILRK